uniref:Vacuolar ATPase assembly integral membrane protein VMA21 homolog n=1 Tax=Stomoxys calcitrans TaxID=35570 RepID=A0A1I8Q1M3_STOCA
MGKNKLNVAKKEQLAAAAQIKENSQDVPADSSQATYVSEDYDNSSTNAFMWLFAFSVLMFTFPFLTFYAVRSWLEESFDFDTFQRNCFSVLASVLVVNFIVCLYVYKAFSENDGPTPKPSNNANKKQD